MQNVYLNKFSQSQNAYVIPTQIKKSQQCQSLEAALRLLPVINRAASSKSYLINSPEGIYLLGGEEDWNK